MYCIVLCYLYVFESFPFQVGSLLLMVRFLQSSSVLLGSLTYFLLFNDSFLSRRFLLADIDLWLGLVGLQIEESQIDGQDQSFVSTMS